MIGLQHGKKKKSLLVPTWTFYWSHQIFPVLTFFIIQGQFDNNIITSSSVHFSKIIFITIKIWPKSLSYCIPVQETLTSPSVPAVIVTSNSADRKWLGSWEKGWCKRIARRKILTFAHLGTRCLQNKNRHFQYTYCYLHMYTYLECMHKNIFKTTC